MEIKSLANTDFEELFDAFSRAFADYELQLDRQQLGAMLLRRGFSPDLSFAAFDSGRIVSFTYNGIGNFDGVATAYDTGTGTLKEYRGQGLAAKVFEYFIPYLKQAGVKQYLLEVLQHNTSAVSVYRKIGFEVSREFYYYRAATAEIADNYEDLDLNFTFETIDINNHPEIESFRDFAPSWQNSIESIKRAAESFICTGVFTGGKMVGYSVFEPATGDVTQIAVDRKYRRKGIGSALLHRMIESGKCDTIKIINTDVRCDSVAAFLKSKRMEPSGKQFEMIKVL